MDTWFWIGGTDKEAEGYWKWVNGSDWNFTQWATNPSNEQPSGGIRQNCLQIYHGVHATDGWKNQNCFRALPFICSWKICPGRSPPEIEYLLKSAYFLLCNYRIQLISLRKILRQCQGSFCCKFYVYTW